MERRKVTIDRRNWRPDFTYNGEERRVTCRRQSGWSTRLNRWVHASEWITLPAPFDCYEITLGGLVRRQLKSGDWKECGWKEHSRGYLYRDFKSEGKQKAMNRGDAIMAAMTGEFSSSRVHTCHGTYGKRCDQPDNLRHASASENQRDRHRDGTTGRWTMLQVATFRRRVRSGESITSLAREVGVAHALMSRVVRGLNYLDCPEPPVPATRLMSTRKLTAHQVTQIVELKSTHTLQQLAEIFRVGRSTICMYLNQHEGSKR